jgi:hypothetical protein
MKEIFPMAIRLILMLGIVCTSVAGLAYGQAGTTSGNVTAQIAPQGTSLNTLNKTTTPGTNESGTTSGNVTAQIAPQGTSLNANSSKGNLTMKR